MDKKDFLGIMQELNVVYGDRKFPLTEQTLDIWNKYLGGYSEENVHEAVRSHVVSSPFPPTVSEIIGNMKKYQDEACDKATDLDNVFRAVVANYPCGYGDAEERKAFDNLTEGSLYKARQVLTITRNIVLGWELSGEKHIPSLKDFLERVRV